MNLNDNPHLPKWPFLVGDAALLLTAGVIARYHPHPFSPAPLIIITACVAAGAVLAVVPFLAEYGRGQDEVAQALRESLDAQFKKLLLAADSLGHATAQLKTLDETAAKTLQAAEKLPHRLQEKITEFSQRLAQTDEKQKEQLEAAARKLPAAAGEAAAQLAQAADAAGAGLEKKLSAIFTAQIDARIKLLEAALAKVQARTEADEPVRPKRTKPEPAPGPLPEEKPKPAEPAVSPAPEAVPVKSPAAPAITGEATAEPAAAALQTPSAGEPPAEPKKKRAPRKPKPAPDAPAGALPLGELIAEPVFDDAAPSDDVSQLPLEERAAPAAASSPATSAAEDGQTRLLVTAYIGIGNKYYVRGEGGGLNWNRGVPLSFISIGKWSWTAPEGSGPISCKLYKNDKDEATNGSILIGPGQQVEIAAVF